MKAYAILDGGGVKAAALAGCLKAAEESGIKFEGYGGTSAGSIVALLACIGNTGDELREIVAEQGELSELLNEDLSELELAQTIPAIFPVRWWELPGQYRRYRALFNKLLTHKGLYDGGLLKEFLCEKITDRMPYLQQSSAYNVRFAQLRAVFEEHMLRKCPLLKIVVSDIGQRRAEVYSACGHPENNGYVIDAVRASTSFPFSCSVR